VRVRYFICCVGAYVAVLARALVGFLERWWDSYLSRVLVGFSSSS